ncbi:class I SAM-dependent methyltransferase [Marinibaculum pumilum]|uniref:Class I SAM-dependent methyltransferase n=1 Tax=Marinibaculum pumilum TaxID=1766165 RepID=A0ABV7KYE6_9PROT
MTSPPVTTPAERHYLHALRTAELDGALGVLPPDFALRDAAVLEIGGADGHVAQLLAARSRQVKAVDVAVPAAPLFPVQRYDGHRLPFPDGAFDLVYSSHVMEHVAHFDAFQAEVMRILRPGGLALHVVPTAAWRFWTLVAHYPALPKLVANRLRGPMAGQGDPDAARPARRGPWHAAMRLAAAAPHGETGTALQELRHFSLRDWRRRFRACGWQLVECRSLGLFYSGYMLAAGRLSMPARRRIAALAGASSGCLLLAPPAGRAGQ